MPVSPAAYLSGGRDDGFDGAADLGIITMDEVAFFIRQVSRAGGLPVLVDGDTGYGEALNVMNMVRTSLKMPAPRRFISRISCCRRNAVISTTRSSPMRMTWQPRSPPLQRLAGIFISSQGPTPLPARVWTARSHARNFTSKPAPMRYFRKR